MYLSNLKKVSDFGHLAWRIVSFLFMLLKLQHSSYICLSIVPCMKYR